MQPLKIFVLAAYFFIAYLTVAGSEDFGSKSKISNDKSLAMASRYGRSSTVFNKGRHMLVVPRIDRFFLSSRYGKRSNYENSPEYSNLPPFSDNLSCSYTGYSNLYRCSQRLDLVNDEILPEQ